MVIGQNIFAALAIIGWFAVPTGGGLIFLYGKYGAILFGLLSAAIASIKYRNPFAWLAIGMWLPLAGLIVLAFLPRLYLRLCPFCLEGIEIKAAACPHCTKDIGENKPETKDPAKEEPKIES